MINKLTMNLLILLVIPCILYGRSFNVMDFGAQGNHIIETKILNILKGGELHFEIKAKEK